MKIEKVQIIREPMQLTRPYTIAFMEVDSVENIFVILETDTGEVGIGAASPAEEITGESMGDCHGALTTLAEPVLHGMDVRFLRANLRRLATDMAKTPAALAAVDGALHDLYAKHLDLPLVELLGRAHASMATSITIGIMSVQETLEEAEEYLGRGFNVLKVKTGKDLEEDTERLVKLRERFGNRPVIRVDANQGYTADDYIRFLDKCRDLDLEFVEQPLPEDNLADMRKLPESAREFAMADESLHFEKDALTCLEPPRAFGLFNIKLMKCGGIAPGLRIADVANTAGIGLMWGCMDESAACISAALHAALASPATRYLDLDGSLDLASDLVTGGFELENGIMRTLDRPGLGILLA